MFRNAIKKALKERRFKLVGHGLAKMIVDTNPFPSMVTNVTSASRCNFHPKIEKGKQLMQSQWRVKKVTDSSRSPRRYSTLSPRQLKSIVNKPNVFYISKFLHKAKPSSIEGHIFCKLQFPKVDEDSIPNGKRCVTKISIEEGVSSLGITIQDDKQMRPHKMIKPRTMVKKGEWFLNKYIKREKS